MIQNIEVSIGTSNETLKNLIGSQILRLEVDGLVLSPSIHHNVTECFKQDDSIVIHFNNSEALLVFTRPVQMSYYPEGNLR